MKEKTLRPETEVDRDAAPSETTARSPLAANRLVISLLVVLFVAVCVQGAVLFKLASRDRAAEEPAAEAESESAEPWPAVSSPDRSALPGLGSQDPAASFPDPFDSGFTDSFFSDEWQPFAEMAQMRERMARLFEDSSGLLGNFPSAGASLATAVSQPAIADEGDHYLVTLDVPGADESSFNISLEDDVLTISCVRDEVNERTDADGTVIGRSKKSSNYLQSFTLPERTDATRLETDYQDGILTIKVPKAGDGA